MVVFWLFDIPTRKPYIGFTSHGTSGRKPPPEDIREYQRNPPTLAGFFFSEGRQGLRPPWATGRFVNLGCCPLRKLFRGAEHSNCALPRFAVRAFRCFATHVNQRAPVGRNKMVDSILKSDNTDFLNPFTVKWAIGRNGVRDSNNGFGFLDVHSDSPCLLICGSASPLTWSRSPLRDVIRASTWSLPTTNHRIDRSLAGQQLVKVVPLSRPVNHVLHGRVCYSQGS